MTARRRRCGSSMPLGDQSLDDMRQTMARRPASSTTSSSSTRSSARTNTMNSNCRALSLLALSLAISRNEQAKSQCSGVSRVSLSPQNRQRSVRKASAGCRNTCRAYE
jgi:hypothetical protein